MEKPLGPRPLARGLVGLGALAGFGYLAPALTAAWAGPRELLGVRDTVASGSGFALTFDDGPHPRGTPAVLEVLSRLDVRAVFFLVGEQVVRFPALAREIAAAGHEIALHCDRHRNLLRLGPRQVEDDLDRAHARIVEATGQEPRLYRPPYGILNLAALTIARRRGWQTLLWSHWGRDWELRATPESIATLATRDLRPGAVVLLHDADHYSVPGSWRATAAALPALIERLRAAGLEWAAV